MDDTFSGSDFSSAASATASPATTTADPSPAEPTPIAPVTPESTAPAATVQASATPPVSETEPGPMPFAAHKTALENARTKARQEVEQQYAWAKGIPKEAVDALPEWSRIAQRMTTDPIGFLNDFMEELHTHPAHGPQLRSQAGRILSRARGQQAVDHEPDVQILDTNGNVTGATYSAEKVKAIVTQAVQDAIGKEVAPLKQEHQQRQATEKAAQDWKAVESKADAIMADVADIIGQDKAAYTEVGNLMAQHPDWTAQKAAWHYHKTVVLPGLSKSERVKVLADISNKPAASMVSPSSGTTSVPKPDSDKDWTELLAEKSAALTGTR